MSVNDIDQSWLEAYLHETTSMIEQLEIIIINCERDKMFSEENINEIFRIMHTIKGSSSMMSYMNISSIAHSLEDLFYYIREKESKNMEYSRIVEFVLSGIDFMNEEIGKIINNQEVDGDNTILVEQISKYLLELKSLDTVEGSQHENIYKAIIYFQDGCEMENIRAYTIVHNIPEDFKDISYEPADILDNENTIFGIREQGFQLCFKSTKSEEEVYQWLMEASFVSHVELCNTNENTNDTTHEEVLLENSNVEQLGTMKPSEVTSSGKSSSMISVSVEKLDRLLDLIGEIVIAEDMVIQNPDLIGLKLDRFKRAASQLSKITGDIQDLVMEIRMVPLEATFLKMNRIVRDVSKKLNKAVELVIQGEDTEVDKKIIEQISDPLMHLVRNSIDHGIESQEERSNKGKSAVGKIYLEAKNEGSDVIIHVRDDGKGLSTRSIHEKAILQGLVKEEEVLSDKEIYNLIFAPGFSTKEEVTEFSGRGVGMDVVAKNIESIGGSLYIDSKENEGTTITLKLPLTLAIIDGMNIKVGEARYTIPTISIKETFRPHASQIIKAPDGNVMIMVRGECYTVRKLHELYHVETKITDFTQGIVVMVEQEEQMVAIFADELIGQQQVVVKALPEYIKKYTTKENGLAGCTLLGDGSISLIIDVSKMLNLEKYN